jgi:Flp pilus assembly protein TadG
MRTSIVNKNKQKGATMMLLMLGLPLVFLPLVGLAIDGTRLYIVQAKLSAAVDGAALGAGRLLGTVANTSEIANEFLNVNFPAGYWGTSNLNPTINYTNTLGTNTISVSATVQSPLLFMRIFGYPYSTVGSAAVATRKNTRVVLVLDHSGSMNCLGACPATMSSMLAGATQFTGMFTPNYDELGLVAFSGSAVVAYPEYTLPYDPNPLSGTQQGPDKNFATSPTTGPMFDQINAMVANGGTNSAEALSMAYLELQKGHNRDAAAGGDNNLNSIVFFTDGIPTALSVSPNNPSNNSLLSTSPCTYNPAHTTVDAAHTMAGYFVIHGATPGWSSGAAPNGLMLLRSTDATHTGTWWLGHGLGDYGPSPTPSWSNPSGTGAVNPNPYAAIAGCGGMNSSNWSTSDLAKIPTTDYWGNSTGGSAYNLGMSWTSPCNVSYTPTQVSNPCQWGLAIWNAVDNVGNTIRSGGAIAGYPAPTGMLPVTIFTIGYNGNASYPIDPVLLKRLANTQDATSYSASQQVGMFIQVNNSSTLSSAFEQVASSLLRLAQ